MSCSSTSLTDGPATVVDSRRPRDRKFGALATRHFESWVQRVVILLVVVARLKQSSGAYSNKCVLSHEIASGRLVTLAVSWSLELGPAD